MALSTEYTEVMIVDPVRDGVRLRAERLAVAVSDDDRDGVFVAADEFSTICGAGNTPDVAIRDYVANLFYHFAFLDANRQRLNSRPRDERERLDLYVARDA